MKTLAYLLSCLFVLVSIPFSGIVSAQTSWQSALLQIDNDGNLQYLRDADGNQIPDFSYAGYKNSNAAIPDVPVVKTLSPIAGDNTTHIQTALNEVGNLPVDSAGFRGALLLTAGVYPINGILRIADDGVVLRGVGDGEDSTSNTILTAPVVLFPQQRDLLVAGGGGSSLWSDSIAGTTRLITSDSILVGERSFTVDDATPFAIGDNIIIRHPCTAEWLAAIDSGGTFSGAPGATVDDIPWEVGSQPIVYNRFITDIQGNQITIDAPVFNHLIRALSPSFIYKHDRQSIKTHIGIENLRIDIETLGGNDETHAWSAVYLREIEDSWVRNCTFLHFGLSGVYTNTASRITVENCRALDPVSLIEGGRRYNFNAYNASQMILFKDCHASNGRHSYMSNGTTWTSGIVFLNCTSEGAYAASEGHRRWSQGLLYDNVRELDGPRSGYNPRRIGLYNRGHFGTSHGWSAAHSVAWNCDVNGAEIHIQKPPTAQNYAIGCFGTVTGNQPPCSFAVPEGYIEGSNTPGLEPASLFQAQLADRGGPLLAIDNGHPDRQPLPTSTTLHRNYPNPFNPSTTIEIQLPVATVVSLEIYDIVGRHVETPYSATLQPAGTHKFVWDATDANGNPVASGLYFYRIKTEKGSNIGKMMLLR